MVEYTQAWKDSLAEQQLAEQLPEPSIPAGRIWSPQQNAVFSFVADRNRRHGVVEALAGTGKTTTILEALSFTLEEDRVVMLAFNKAIAQELQNRVPTGVDAMTFHSIGLRIITRAHGKRTVDGYATANALQKILGGGRDSKEARQAVAKLIGLAKGCLVMGVKDLLQLADDFELEFPKGWQKARLVGVAQQILVADSQSTGGPITFDDMIWLPIVQNLTFPEYDWVFVDETQDLNGAQLEMAKRLAGEEGRIVAVGDRRQAIYSFRGADSNAIPRMIEELSAEVMPLTVTYRCPRRVVAEANPIVPALEAAPAAPEGSVQWVGEEILDSEIASGDFVISRLNAPLVSRCLRWIAAGKRASIRGRDMGQGMIAWIRSTGLNDPRELRAAINAWRAAEIERLTELEHSTEPADDRAACLIALLEGCRSGDELIGKIERLFSDLDSKDRIQLMSAHRSKGLEAERVWLLRDTFCRDGLDDSPTEERNLLYVAITRSKGELIYVTKGA